MLGEPKILPSLGENYTYSLVWVLECLVYLHQCSCHFYLKKKEREGNVPEGAWLSFGHQSEMNGRAPM